MAHFEQLDENNTVIQVTLCVCYPIDNYWEEKKKIETL